MPPGTSNGRKRTAPTDNDEAVNVHPGKKSKNGNLPKKKTGKAIPKKKTGKAIPSNSAATPEVIESTDEDEANIKVVDDEDMSESKSDNEDSDETELSGLFI
jgi:hypothetical protein